jgi:FMN phosphatase YigB (HAD superfamily)
LLTSASHGKTKPHGAIFRAMLELLDVEPGEALMVGDTIHDDIEGARAAGMQALLLDRDAQHPGDLNRIADLEEVLERLGFAQAR